MEMTSLICIIIIIIGVVVLLMLIIIFACKPWRFLRLNLNSNNPSRSLTLKVNNELERPLIIPDQVDQFPDQTNEENRVQNDPPLVPKQMLPPNSTNGSRLPLTIGRVHPSDLVLNDSEVSGKHAMINWNNMKWELVDMGSLNGTLLNSKPINHPDSGSRRWGDPFDLSSGDTITLGTTTNISVNISSQTEHQIPFSIGVASDPMAARRGGKKLSMEDVCYYQWPLSGTDQFGLFGVCDGHGGAAAAKTASKILPEVVASILSDSLMRERVLSKYDASEILRDAFTQTEARMEQYQYEGCTATLLLVWVDGARNFYAQCANVGDSACVINVEGKHTKMTEDHRISSYSERLRFNETGKPLRDGETRLYGLNLARMLGDKFPKEQEARFSSEPYVSEVVHIDRASNAFALLASDGFWDVISVKKAVQLVNQTRERYSTEEENSAEKIANFLLSEARTLRTKDNTSIIFLDFNRTSYCTKKASSLILELNAVALMEDDPDLMTRDDDLVTEWL
ncbi:hypothetical protein ACFE04_015250 [Oxalis oulophora]